jgi:hypothetical protein
MMNDGTFSAPVELATSRIHRREVYAAVASSSYRANSKVAPQTSTGLWIRRLVEERPELLTQIVRQQSDYAGEQAKCFMVLCGAGHDILVLVNDSPWPVDVNAIPKISLSLCLTTRTLDNSADDIHQYGLIDPVDELWMHMMLAVRAGVFPGRFRIYLTTRFDGPAYLEATAAEKVILRLRMEKNGRISKATQVSPQDAPVTLFSLSNQENDSRTKRPDRKRPSKPSTSMIQKKKPKIATKSDSMQQSLVVDDEGATTRPPKKGQTKNAPTQKTVGKVASNETKKSIPRADASRPNLYGFSLEESQMLQNAFEQSFSRPNLSTAEIPARDLYGFSLDEYKALENAYEAAMTMPDPIKTKVMMPRPKMDSVAVAPLPTKASKQSKTGNKLGLSSSRVFPIAKMNGNTESPRQNLHGFSIDELKVLEKAYESNTSTPVNPDVNVLPPKVQAVPRPLPKKPAVHVVEPKAPSALPVTTETAEDQKRCFYFPYCTKLSSECGGRQRGRCREVKAGNVTVPKDDQEFRKVKKKALRALNQQKKKADLREV